MSINTRKEYLKKVKQRYLKANKSEKGSMLSEFIKNTGYNKKYAIRILAPAHSYKDKCINRKAHFTYTNNDIYYLKKIWEIMDYPCGQRMAPMLEEMIAKLVQFKELTIPESVQKKLVYMGSSTIDLRLKPFRAEIKRKINSTTKPGSLLKKSIPIRTISWNEQRIGCFELDTVAHCGSNADGDFISSLDMTDILTGWTETEAIMGRAQSRVLTGLDNMKERLPFNIVAIDPDNGSEFINWQLFRYCEEKEIEFTRGRPYHKNDNAHIEQKNWTHVRKIFGYKRRETEVELEIMNDLYRNEIRLYKNFFMPQMKLIAKTRYGKHKEKIKKKYDKPKTPYQRVLECKDVSQEIKDKLRKQYEKLNPAELKRNIDQKLKKLNQINQITINKTMNLKPLAKVTFSNRLTN